MTPRSIQLYKEVRQLLWPWSCLVLGGLLSFLHIPRDDYSWSPADLLNWILPFGCFVAIPLLAALPLGNEFQHRTIGLLLAQPVDRRELWLQKTMVTLAAVLPVAILYLFSFGRNQEFEMDFWMPAVWIVAATAGSVAGTLLARSAVGGLALSSAFFGVLFVIWSKLAESQRHHGDIPTAFLWVTGIVVVGCAVGIMWLGRRMFLRFQIAEGPQGEVGLATAARFIPRFAIDWLRCRPRGAILNLIRREVGLLRVLWLLSLLSFVTWGCLVVFHFVKPRDFPIESPPVALAIMLSLLIALLAGALSLGEEKTQGTHMWQLTLPVSSWTQWGVKLAVALCASLISAVGVPLIVLLVSGWLVGAPLSYLGNAPLLVFVLEAFVITSVAFWCSCIVKGTVRATLWCFPVLFALGLAGALGNWMSTAAINHTKFFADLLFAKIDPFRANRMVTSVLGLGGSHGSYLPLALAVIVGPLLAVGLLQSHRLFRGQLEDRKFHAIRSTFPPLMTLVLSFFVVTAVFLFAWRLRQEQVDIVREAHIAIEALEAGANGPIAPNVQQFTLDDLAKAGALSIQARHWLSNSTVVVRRETDARRPLSLLWPYEYAFLAPAAPGKNAVSYSATIRTPRGSECNLRFWASRSSQTGFLSQSCR